MRQARRTVAVDEPVIYVITMFVGTIPVVTTLLRHARFGGIATLGLVVIGLSLLGLVRARRAVRVP